MEVLGDVYRGVALHGERIEFADTVRIAEPLNPLVRPAGNIIESHPRELDLRLQHNYVVVVGYDTDLHAYVPAFGPNGVFESKEDSLVQLAGHLSVDEKTAGAFLDRLQRDCASRPRRPH
jgi:hypothetical protein